jgi:hypothetical protein
MPRRMSTLFLVVATLGVGILQTSAATDRQFKPEPLSRAPVSMEIIRSAMSMTFSQPTPSLAGRLQP